MPQNFTFPLAIGTRSSELAIAQANQVKREILAAHPEISETDIEIIKIKTSGDKFLEQKISLIGGKGLFTKEIEESLLSKDIDIAVHSVKDLPAELPDGLIMGAFLEREDPTDAFISTKHQTFGNLPENAVIGTSALRRKAILLNLRPDLNIVDIRGNINTRLRKLKEQDLDGIILAAAGLKRVGIESSITQRLDPDVMLPAIGQGAVGIECRENDHKVQKILAKINHQATAETINIERYFMKLVDGDCRTPIACYVKYLEEKLMIKAMIIHPLGTEKYIQQELVSANEAHATIDQMVGKIHQEAAPILDYIEKHG